MTQPLEMIAVTGMSCRFPGAPSLGAFWAALREGRDGTIPVPPQRWNADAVFDADARKRGKTNCRVGGFISDVDLFDAAFFDIPPREAAQMDPQQRILLELTYEALEDAGIAPGTLAGSDTAVFVGAMTNDYLRHQFGDSYRRIDVHTGSGAGLCMLANRLSYYFDLRGPSAAIDTACSSSLVAIFQACQALWTGQSSLAVAAGVNVMLDPGLNVFYAQAGLSAPDGRCKTFSAAADGIGRAEGAGVIVLKRLGDALADRDPVYAVIRGGAVNHDGRSNGLTQPNRWAQEELLRRAFQSSSVAPNDIGYIELHGTGTLIGDPIEANALGTVLTEQGRRDDACLVGSVKTNFGHLEAAAGIAGVIKLALSLAHGEIPPSLWFDAPNPHIAFDRIPIRVNTQLTPWPAHEGRRVGGVSSFGLGGTNAHLVLESPPQPEAGDNQSSQPTEHWLFLSARSETALRALAAAYVKFLSETPASDLPRVCSTALRRKGIHEFRLSIFGADATELIDGLQSFLSGVTHPAIVQGRYRPSHRDLRLVLAEFQQLEPRRLSSWISAGAVSREAWSSCRDVFREVLGVELPSLEAFALSPDVTAGDPNFRGWHFAAQYCLLEQVIAGIPATLTLVGDGLGQLAALCAADALSLDAAIRWLGAGSSSKPPEGEPRPSYAIPCDFSRGRNPPLHTIEWKMTRSWHECLREQSGYADTDVVLLNLCGLSAPGQSLESVMATSFALGDERGGINRIIARLVLCHPLAGSAAVEAREFIRLPAYPWQRDSFWLLDEAARATHSLLGSRRSGPTPEWESRLSVKSLPYIPDHRVQDMTVLPGSGYVELGLAIHHEISGQPHGVLEDLVLHKALVIDDPEPLLRVTYDEESREYTVYTQRLPGERWNLHARGKLSLVAPEAAAAVDLQAIKRRCTQLTDAETHYEDMLSRGFQYGPYFRGMRSLWLDAGGEEVLAWIEGSEQLAAARHENRLHPALFDAALQSLLTPLRAKGDTELYIPVGIRELRLHKVPANGFWCHGTLKTVAAGIVEGEATLFDKQGVVIAQARGVRAQALTQKDRDELRSIDQWLYEYVWESAGRQPAKPRPGRWMLFADRDPAAELLQRELEAAGAGQIIRVCPGAAFQQQSATQYVVARDAKADLQRLLQSVGAAGLAGIVYLWGLDAPADERALLGSDTQIASAMLLIQTIQSESGADAPKLFVVTRGAQSVRSEPLAGIMQAPLTALVRVAVSEYPFALLRAIDIDDDSVTLANLAAEILSDSAEDELALRGAQRFVHRMVRKAEKDLQAQARATGDAGAPDNRPFQPEGTHLITGGLGGFGLKIAEWMVGQGARHLVLVGRNGARQPHAQQALERLRERGAEVVAVAADISQESEVRSLIERIRRDLPPLRGVYHAAAVLDDAPIAHVQQRQIDNAMGAKAIGAWHLHRLTQDDPLSYFVLFSSIASLVGGSGQATYAMSCICLDALARLRRERGLPAISMNWGALAQVGMATRYRDAEKHLGRTGVGLFTPSQAVKLFGRVLQWNPVELGIAMMDWKLWGTTYPGWAASPKFATLLVQHDSTAPASAKAELLQTLAALTPEDRVAAICVALTNRLADALQVKPEKVDSSKSLVSLGVDSLMAMDLQEAIERDFAYKISTLELMKGNSLVALAQQLALWIAAPPGDAAAAPAVEEDADPLWRRALGEEMDTVDAERIIAQLGELTEAELDGLLNKLTDAQEIVR
jgi:acyl transferase domain-containing protein/acyl carrier protein